MSDPFDGPCRILGPWFTASYPGDCDECGGEFEAGDMIRADGDGGYLCEDCGEDG